MQIAMDMTLFEKLTILSDAAKYDVACTSSGVDRVGQPGDLRRPFREQDRNGELPCTGHLSHFFC